MSLYQQQRRVTLVIPELKRGKLSPHTACLISCLRRIFITTYYYINYTAAVVGDGSEVAARAENLDAPLSSNRMLKRRPAVHGLSPNTGLSIGAVM